jgi:hypothetical protein
VKQWGKVTLEVLNRGVYLVQIRAPNVAGTPFLGVWCLQIFLESSYYMAILVLPVYRSGRFILEIQASGSITPEKVTRFKT